uniref:Very long-chain fatty acid transport protein n=1 Tax=Syphacia muris TaxID=451379 RepID=A0A158R5Y7_9BILA
MLRSKSIFGGGAVIVLAALSRLSSFYFLLGLLFTMFLYKFGDFYYRSFQTISRDIGGLILITKIRLDIRRRIKQDKPIGDIFLEVVKKYPDKIAFIDINSERELTFSQLNEEANKYANYFQLLGYRSGDVIALFMENSVDFVTIWLGLAKIGVVTAWINYNLKLEPLAHCIKTSNAKTIIYSSELESAINGVVEKHLLTNENLKLIKFSNDENDAKGLRHIVNVNGNSEEPKKLDRFGFKSTLCLVYTSGTTGLPKAAVMKHYRYYWMAMGIRRTYKLSSDDRLYVTLPLYHTTAGILGIGQTMLYGTSSVIRKKFSASRFWSDCTKYHCTLSLHIGEICRYLLAQKPCPEEQQHSLRMFYGSGLRKEIWDKFTTRFRVKVGESYGSTEGTSTLVNDVFYTGACGYLPISPLTKYIHPVRLVKVDEATGDVIRGPNGLCIPCVPGETGAMVSTIHADNMMLNFQGYSNEAETNKKILRNVFKKGDCAFLSGDVLHWDKLGYVYFKDRTGDTFRWKGENVSTSEIEAVLHSIPSVEDGMVYGVTVPGKEGRAGMAALVKSDECQLTDEEFVKEVYQRLEASLASYAIPVFIRICSSLELTGTFKLMKVNMKNLGYKLNGNGDKVFFLNSKKREFCLLDEETLAELERTQFQQL